MVTATGKRNMKALGSGRPAKTRPTYAATQLAAPAGGTGATAGAYDTAGNRDLMIASVNAARTDIAAILTVLRDYGFIN